MRFLIDPEAWPNYKIGDPTRPIGTTESLNGQLVRKWVWYCGSNDLEPIWPSQHHKTSLIRRGWEGAVRVIYDPETHSIITRTIRTALGDVAPDSLELQRQAFLALSQHDPALRWMPDGDHYVVGKTEIAHIPSEALCSLRSGEQCPAAPR